MVKVLIKADSKFPINRPRIRSLVSRVLIGKGVSGKVVVSIAIVGDRKMLKLNKDYKSINSTTDVLSFPYTQDFSTNGSTFDFVENKKEGLQLGDIVVSYPQAVKQAMKENKLVDDKLDFLIEHGLLHLLGIHHD